MIRAVCINQCENENFMKFVLNLIFIAIMQVLRSNFYPGKDQQGSYGHQLTTSTMFSAWELSVVPHRILYKTIVTHLVYTHTPFMALWLFL